MLQRLRSHPSAVLWGAAFLLVAASLHFMFQAGCAGDLKGGSLGNMQLAQDHEATATLLAWGGILAGIVAIALRRSLDALQRFGVGLLFFVFAFIGLTLTGIQFEVWGVQACF